MVPWRGARRGNVGWWPVGWRAARSGPFNAICARPALARALPQSKRPAARAGSKQKGPPHGQAQSKKARTLAGLCWGGVAG